MYFGLLLGKYISYRRKISTHTCILRKSNLVHVFRESVLAEFMTHYSALFRLRNGHWKPRTNLLALLFWRSYGQQQPFLFSLEFIARSLLGLIHSTRLRYVAHECCRANIPHWESTMPRSDSNPKIQIQRLVFNGQFTSLLDSSPIREQLYYIVTPRQKKKKDGCKWC